MTQNTNFAIITHPYLLQIECKLPVNCSHCNGNTFSNILGMRSRFQSKIETNITAFARKAIYVSQSNWTYSVLDIIRGKLSVFLTRFTLWHCIFIILK